MNNRELTIVLVIIGLVLGIMGYYGGWWDDLLRKPKIETAPAAPPVPKLIIHQTKLVGWEDQKKTWEIEAEKIWQSSDGNYIYFENVTKGVFFSKEKDRVDFTAGWVRYEKIPSVLFIGNGLEAIMEDGKLMTEEATMKYRQDVLVCPKPVRFEGKEVQLQANSLELDYKTEEIILRGDVRLEQEDAVVEAGELIFQRKEKKYRLVKPGEITVKL